MVKIFRVVGLLSCLLLCLWFILMTIAIDANDNRLDVLEQQLELTPTGK
jgi:hypothetical protein